MKRPDWRYLLTGLWVLGFGLFWWADPMYARTTGVPAVIVMAVGLGLIVAGLVPVVTAHRRGP